MTVPVDHTGLEVLAPDDCLALVAGTPVGRVAFVDAGAPVVLPVNHAVDGRSVVFRTAYGAKLGAAIRASVVAFEADEYDRQARDGWSVLVTGVADIVEDPDEIEALDALDLHPWADSVDRPFWVRIRPDEITGRRI